MEGGGFDQSFQGGGTDSPSGGAGGLSNRSEAPTRKLPDAIVPGAGRRGELDPIKSTVTEQRQQPTGANEADGGGPHLDRQAAAKAAVEGFLAELGAEMLIKELPKDLLEALVEFARS